MTVDEIGQIIAITLTCAIIIVGVIGVISINHSMNKFYKRLVPGALMGFNYSINEENPFKETEHEVFRIKILDVKDGWCKYCFWSDKYNRWDEEHPEHNSFYYMANTYYFLEDKNKNQLL